MPDNPSTAEPKKPRRGWLKFRLRTLLILVALLAVPCAYIGWQAKIARSRSAWLDTHPEPVEERYAVFERENIGDSERSPGVVRRWLGDEAHRYIYVELSDRDTARNLFPEAHLIILGQHVEKLY